MIGNPIIKTNILSIQRWHVGMHNISIHNQKHNPPFTGTAFRLDMYHNKHQL